MSFGTLDWATVRPATAIGKTFGYFDVPAFSFDSGWLGASVIVAQYNISLTRNFVLRNRPTKPANSNCLLAIRYRVGSTVYRYKLWEDSFCTLQADLYTGQVIKKNCVIEIWSLSTSTNMSQTAVMRLYTSLMQIVTDFTVTPADYADATAALNSDEYEQNLYPIYTTGLVSQYDAALGATNPNQFTISRWADTITGKALVTAGTNPAYVPTGDPLSLNGKPWIFFGPGSALASANGDFPLAGNNGIGSVYIVLQLQAWTIGQNIILVTTNNVTHRWAVSARVGSPQLEGGVGTPTVFTPPFSDLGLSSWHILRVSVENILGAGNITTQVDDGVEQFATDGGGSGLTGNSWSLGTLGSVAEVLLYSSNPVNGDAADLAIKSYLAAKFRLAFPLPMVFSDNSPFLDNT